MIIRAASVADARDLAKLLNMAGEHLPEFQWRQQAAPGQDPLEIGAQRAAREQGAFSFRNARIAEIDGQTAGMLLGYRLPDPYDAGDTDSLPDVVRPLVELECQAPGTWYLNALATYEPFRGQGVASKLMSTCDDIACSAGATRLSLIVASENTGAHRLYLKLGYKEVASRPMEVYPGGPRGGDWLLMLRDLF